ncbi:MAG: ribonuclease P protein component [Lachnospiraceae bacterium]|nr:ribonuclease P protein component [Lachnospiraceae bacterium]
MDSLKKNQDFQAVYNNGTSRADSLLVLYVLKKEGQEKSRVGISVSKKVGNSIVRHRLKRQLREICRLRETELLCGCDLVIIARNRAKGRSYQELERALLRLAAVQNTKGARETT